MKKYVAKTKEEALYIAGYDPSKYYPNPAVTVDLAVYAFDDSKNTLKLLLIQRGGFPYKGDMAIPGGFLDIGETVENAALRELEEETGITGMDSSLHCLLSQPERDPRQRVITAEYIALANIHDIAPKAGDDAAKAVWYEVSEFSLSSTRKNNLLTTNYYMKLTSQASSIAISAKRTDDYSLRQPVRSFEVLDDGDLAFDHAEAVIKSFLALRDKLMHTDIVCGALGRRFCKEAYNDVLRAAKLDPRLVNNESLYEDEGELSVLPASAQGALPKL